jgi:hypothetical protein
VSNLRLVLAAVLASACSRPAAPPPAPAAPAPPGDPLAQLDPRTPLPLLPHMANHQKQNMRDHLVAVQEIVAGLGADDLAAVERAAGRIASSPEMAQMCTHMGAGAPGFTEQSLGFHQTADGILAAARAGDRAAVLAHLDATLRTCTGCHAQWKQQIVDAPTFEKLGARAAH